METPDYPYYWADVFTDRPFGGNPLAVFPQASGLEEKVMQAVASELNLSETVFVLPPVDPRHTCRLRIFTPGVELPFAGHPTVGTACVLAETGRVPLTGETTEVVFEEGVGPVRVSIQAPSGRPPTATLHAPRLPEWGPPPPSPGLLAALLNLNEDDLLAGADRPEAVSGGVPFLFIPLRSLQAVSQARLELELWQEHLAAYWAPHIYIFSYQTENPGADLHARMFAPAMGIPEDPATGAGAVALAGYLAARHPHATGHLAWRIEQGLELGRPSLIELAADKEEDRLTAIRVGGRTVMVGEGALRLPGAFSAASRNLLRKSFNHD